jgi:PhnB protein
MKTDSAPTYPPESAVVTVPDAAVAVAFYARAFGATERFRLTDPVSGRIAHVELDLLGGLLMLAEGPLPADPVAAPSLRLCLYVGDADAVMRQAAVAGAWVQRPPRDEFYGHRCGRLRDPFGHEWMVFHANEAVTPAEMQLRWNALAGPGPTP